VDAVTGLDDLLEDYPPPAPRCCVCESDPEMLELVAEFVRRLDAKDPRLHGWCIAGTGARTRSLYKVLQERFQFSKSRYSLERHVEVCCGRAG
jgi:hypothetical protein